MDTLLRLQLLLVGLYILTLPLGAQQSIILEGHSLLVYSAHFNTDGTRIVTAAGDETAIIWDAHSGTMLRSIEAHPFFVYTAVYHPDGSRIATGGWDGLIIQWNPETGEAIDTLRGHEGDVTTVTYNADGTRIASGSRDNTVRMWNTATATEVRTFSGHTSLVTSVAISPDGSLIAAAAADGIVKIWSTADGTEKHELAGHFASVTSVAFHPDGTRLASAGKDGIIVLWNVESGSNLGTLEGHLGGVNSVEFSADGNLLLSASEDASARIWDWENNKVQAALEGHTGAVNGASFGPSTNVIATASSDNTGRVWFFDPSGIEVAGAGDNLLNFGKVRMEEWRDSLITIRNTGSTAVVLSDIMYSNLADNQFVHLEKPSLPHSIAAAGELHIRLRFAPNAIGEANGRIVFSFNEGSEFYYLNLEGEGLEKKVNSVEDESNALAEILQLHAPAPNPVATETQLRYDVRRSQELELFVVDMSGRTVVHLFHGSVHPGTYTLPFRVETLAAGAYRWVARSPLGTLSVALMVQR